MLRVINGKTAAPKCVRQVDAVAPEEVERSWEMEIVEKPVQQDGQTCFLSG